MADSSVLTRQQAAQYARTAWTGAVGFLRALRVDRLTDPNLLRNMTVRSSLVACGALVVISSGVALSSFMYSASVERDAMEAQRQTAAIGLHVEQIGALVQEARRREQEFLRVKDPEVYTAQQAVLKRAGEVVGALDELTTEAPQLAEQAHGIRAALDKYAESMAV